MSNKNLLDLLQTADVLEIDDFFVRHFNLENFNDDFSELNDTCLEVSVINDDFVKLDWLFTFEEILNAKYDENKQKWIVREDIEITLYLLKKCEDIEMNLCLLNKHF